MAGSLGSALTIDNPRTSAVATMMRSPGSAFAARGTVATLFAISAVKGTMSKAESSASKVSSSA
jgi:hypothetical protein